MISFQLHEGGFSWISVSDVGLAKTWLVEGTSADSVHVSWCAHIS